MKFNVIKSENLIKCLIHNIQGMSFSAAQKTVRLGNVRVNSKRIKNNIVLNIGDIVDVYEFKKSKPNIPVLYKDENILIVNKPQNIECATRDKSSQNTYSLEEIFEEENAIVVHRLDRLTEGIVILAKSKEIASKFEKIFRTRQIDKFYKACVHNTPSKTGILKAYHKKNTQTALVEISDNEKDNFKEIITEVSIEESFDNFSILDIKLHTGRTHQIRAHLAHIGHPIIGDTKYGIQNKKKENIKNIDTSKYNGYYLTAYKIDFKIQDNDLKYLNEINIEIKPSWLDTINKNQNAN